MRRVLFINRFYWPEETATAQLLADLSSALAKRSWEVEVITARTRADLPAQEVHEGVSIRRLGRVQNSSTRLTGKLIDYVQFLGSVFWHLRGRMHPLDTIVVMSDPPLLGAVVWLATPRRSRIVHWIQDIYPEIAMELGAPRWLGGLRGWRNRAWRHASACVTPGTAMRAAVESAGVPRESITVCANWALPELQPVTVEKAKALRVRLGIDDKFVAVYSGNLGRAHDLEPLLKIAEKFQSAPDFLLLFIGNGAQRTSLETTVVRRSLPNVRFIDAQPRASLAETLSAADIHFVTVKPGAERWVFPSKLYGIVSVGKPVIFIGASDSEIALTITSNGWGLCFSPSQIEAAVTELQLLQREPERLLRFADATRIRRADDFTVALNMWTALLDRVNDVPSPAR